MKKERKTFDEFEVQGNYGGGWECVCSEDTRREAVLQLRCYNENEPQYPHRLIKRRIKKENPNA